MKANGLVMGVLLVIGIAIGFLLCRMTGDTGGSGDETGADGAELGGAPAKSDRDGGGLGSRSGDGERAGTSGRSAAATIREAARELELSPMGSMDFDAVFGVYDAIRRMTLDEIRIAYADLDEAMSNPELKEMTAMMLINHWAKQDGRSAVEFALNQKEGSLKSTSVVGGVTGWVEDDPEGAYAWYMENRKELAKGSMLALQMDGMVLAAIAQRDMDTAFKGLRELNSQQQSSAIQTMGTRMMIDPIKREEFVKHLEGLDDETVRSHGLESMVRTWAIQDPRGAAEFVNEWRWEGNLGAMLRESVASTWEDLDPKVALEWRLEHLSETDDAGEVVAGGFARWVVQDPEGAEKWLRTQPEEVRSDELYQRAASDLQITNNYPAAVQWAEQINDRMSREMTLRTIYLEWNRNDSELAQKWVESLDEVTRKAIESGDIWIDPDVEPGIVPSPPDVP